MIRAFSVDRKDDDERTFWCPTMGPNVKKRALGPVKIQTLHESCCSKSKSGHFSPLTEVALEILIR